MKALTLTDLTEVQREALEAAAVVLKNAYNPYSRFSVGATLITADGSLISGTNFENAAYGATICAERAAILRANSTGTRRILAIAIIARGAISDIDEVVAPCGTCRQVLFELAELSGNDIKVILSNTKMTKLIATSARDLLPLGFGPGTIGIDLTGFRTTG